MICGANSDLFGRRYFIVSGHIFVFVGAIVGGTSHSITQTIVAHVLLGFGSGNCQLSAFAIPELLPNRWRHIGVVIADGVAFFAVIAGPVTARVSIPNEWRWGYWSVAITITLSFAVLVVFYFPPKHPRGIPWDQALRHLDWCVNIEEATWIEGLLILPLNAFQGWYRKLHHQCRDDSFRFVHQKFGKSAREISRDPLITVLGIVYVQLLRSNDPKVIGLLVGGFSMLIFFGLWETFAPLKEPLTPTRLFTNNKGRTLTAPFIVGGVVTMVRQSILGHKLACSPFRRL